MLLTLEGSEMAVTVLSLYFVFVFVLFVVIVFVSFFVLLCVLASVAHLGGELDGSHSAICCFEGRPREGLNANELNFPQRQIGNWHLWIVNQDHSKTYSHKFIQS